MKAMSVKEAIDAYIEETLEELETIVTQDEYLEELHSRARVRAIYNTFSPIITPYFGGGND